MKMMKRPRLSNPPYIDARPEDDVDTLMRKTLASLDQYEQEKVRRRREAERRNRPFFGRLFG
ncbi:hypothetical protein [Corynebacterium variabile]|uniref:hypothetical protein n=1 Tax=Corynebacterium variabile TaxID=1727 RepID=UPI002898D580|nr:hypothetical protein [Corynebacterium variabile]